MECGGSGPDSNSSPDGWGCCTSVSCQELGEIKPALGASSMQLCGTGVGVEVKAHLWLVALSTTLLPASTPWSTLFMS